MHACDENSVPRHLASAQLTIDHAIIANNWKALARRCPGAQTGAVIKADAYGLGASRVAATLYAAGCRQFFVATPEEGVELRPKVSRSEIFVFAGLRKDNAATYAENHLFPVLNTPKDIEVWSNYWKKRGGRMPCAIMLDTGMNRLGFHECDDDWFSADDNRKHSVTPISIMSHLACADESDHPLNQSQLANFERRSLRFAGSQPSLANSAGIFLGEQYHQGLVRPGIALYAGVAGFVPGDTITADMPQCAISLTANILQIRSINAGDTVGYGATHRFDKPGKIAVIGVGYADGFHRSLSGSGVTLRRSAAYATTTENPQIQNHGALAWLEGYDVPIVGRVSMDSSALDVSSVPDRILQNAKSVELYGPHASLQNAAQAAGTIDYELLTALGSRFHRHHINQACEPADAKKGGR